MSEKVICDIQVPVTIKFWLMFQLFSDEQHGFTKEI